MQVDAAKVKRLTPEERLKLIREGKCFGCHSKDHLYSECPQNPKKKKKRQFTKKPGKPKARAADAGTSASVKEVTSDEESEKEEEDAPPPYTKKKIMAAIKALSVEEREDLMDNMALESDQDF